MERETRVSKTPFDLYDFFGYLIPGFIFLMAIVLFYLINPALKADLIHFLNLSENDLNIIDAIKNIKGFPWWFDLILLFSVIAISYLIGHVISSLSSLLIDKFLIKKMAGYPYQKLFRENFEARLQFKSGFYKFFLVLTNGYLFRLLFFKIPSNSEIITLIIVLVVIIAVKMRISDIFAQHNFSTSQQNVLVRIGKVISFPFNFLMRFIEHSLGLNEPFDNLFIKNFMGLFEQKFNLSFNSAGTNIFWLSYCYVSDLSEHLRNLIRHFLRLYGFTRNLSIVFYLIFLISILISIWLPQEKDTFVKVGICTFLMFFILLNRYYYLYYNYYSKLVFRSFYYLAQTEK